MAKQPTPEQQVLADEQAEREERQLTSLMKTEHEREIFRDTMDGTVEEPEDSGDQTLEQPDDTIFGDDLADEEDEQEEQPDATDEEQDGDEEEGEEPEPEPQRDG